MYVLNKSVYKEMADSNNEICRLCLKITPSCEYITIDEIRKEILEVLSTNINLDISDYAVVCNRCLESLHNCLDFKSRCINIFRDVDIKVDIKKEGFQSELINHESICQENPQVCRFCMSLFEVKSLICTAEWKDGVLLNDIVRNCLPDLDLNAVHEASVCKRCLSSITKYYEFLKSCQEVEQKIERFCQVKGPSTIGRVNLKDMITFKNSDVPINPTIIKKECPHVECDDMKCLKSAEIMYIKCEEVDIKDELEHGVETGESVQSGDYDNSGNFSKGHIRNIESKDTTFSLRAHLASYRGPTKAFGCHACPFETDAKNSLKKHLLKHKDKSEVKMQKCLLCPFESKYKSVLLRHQKLEHRKNIEMYKCEKCSFSSKYRKSITRHQLVHKNPQEIPKLQCDKCDYQTRNKRYLARHVLTHGVLEVASKFKCEKCPYQCKQQQDLQEHMMKHSNKYHSGTFSRETRHQTVQRSCDKNNPQRRKRRVHQKDSIRQIHKCKLCDYQAKTGRGIKNHMIKIHMNPFKVPTFKCALCPYESTSKKYLSRHITLRDNHNHRPTFKCPSCLYVTTKKVSLKKHMVIHQEAAIKCNQCDFRTKHKSCIYRHMKLHEPARPSTFKCDKCEYSTWRKSNFDQHKVTHMKLGEAAAYKCPMCDFQTKYKYGLKDHTNRCSKKRNCKKEIG